MRRVVVLAEAAGTWRKRAGFTTRGSPVSAITASLLCWRTSKAWWFIMGFIAASTAVSGCWLAGFPLAFIIWRPSTRRE